MNLSTYESHYASFNVMKAKEHWDKETRAVVENRLEEKPLQFFTDEEALTLYYLCSILLADDRKEIIGFVIHHLDSILHANVGESQRKANVPVQTKLIRKGLAILDQSCLENHDLTFKAFKQETKEKVVKDLMEGVFPLPEKHEHLPMMDFIHKVLTEASSAYYSHPTVWSEIGYAGPAYPRGYVRIQLGLTDPWEAKLNEE
jgi:hypothetical protein